MRPKGLRGQALVCLVGATVWVGARGLRTSATVAWRGPVWSIPHAKEQTSAEANATSAASQLRPARGGDAGKGHLEGAAARGGGGFWEERLQQWDYVTSLFAKRRRGQLTYVEEWPSGPAVNTSINSFGSIGDVGGSSTSGLTALLWSVIIGLPIMLGALLYFAERWWGAAGRGQSEPDAHEGGSISIVMSGGPQLELDQSGAPEVKHHRLIAPFQTFDYPAPSDDSQRSFSPWNLVQSMLVGLSTAMVMLLDAMSFSFFTGASLQNSVWASSIVCMSASLVGGRPGMISGTSAATAVVLARVSRDPDLGLGPMALCVFLGGVLQIIAAALRLSRFVTLIPHSVVVGCINGLAIMTLCAQLRHYHYNGNGEWVSHTFWSVTVTSVVTVVVALAWCRVPHAGKLLPAPLVALLVALGFSAACRSWLPTRTLGDVVGVHTLGGGLDAMPAWDFPPRGVDFHDLHMWGGVVPVAVRFAMAGLFESLMAQGLIDEITGTASSVRRECFGQGVANIVAALYGTQGGGAVAVPSFINVGSGGRTRLAGFVTGILLGLAAASLGRVVNALPAAAPLGLVAVSSLSTIAWGVADLFARQRAFDFFVAAFVTFLTIWDDVAAAVVAGVIISMLGFAWKVATSLRVDSVAHSPSERTFYLRGPLFFGSALSYRSEINPALIKEDVVILDFASSRILDIAGIGAIEKTRDQLRCAGKTVLVRGLPPDAELHLRGQDAGTLAATAVG